MICRRERLIAYACSRPCLVIADPVRMVSNKICRCVYIVSPPVPCLSIIGKVVIVDERNCGGDYGIAIAQPSGPNPPSVQLPSIATVVSQRHCTIGRLAWQDILSVILAVAILVSGRHRVSRVER